MAVEQEEDRFEAAAVAPRAFGGTHDVTKGFGESFLEDGKLVPIPYGAGGDFGAAGGFVGRIAGDDGNHSDTLGAREAVEGRRFRHGVLRKRKARFERAYLIAE